MKTHKLQKKVVCLIETGWEGTRRLTIDLAAHNINSKCLVKGYLDKEVLDTITKYKQICIKPVRRSIFKVYVVLSLLQSFFLRNNICLIMDSNKNYPWVNRIGGILGIETLLLIEKSHAYLLSHHDKPENIAFILGLAGR